MSTPNRLSTVQQVAAAYSHLLTINTSASCCEFTQRCLEAFTDPDWGHVSKTQGESQYTPAGFVPHDVAGVDGKTYHVTGVSPDAVFHKPTNQIIDLLGNATANDDPDPSIHGPAHVQWGEVPQSNNRPNNPWIPSIPVSGSAPVPQPPVHKPYPGDPVWDAVGATLFSDYARAGQAPNPQMGRWFGRMIWDATEGDAAGHVLTVEESITKHRAEWCAVLGIPVTP